MWGTKTEQRVREEISREQQWLMSSLQENNTAEIAASIPTHDNSAAITVVIQGGGGHSRTTLGEGVAFVIPTEIPPYDPDSSVIS